MLETDEPDFPSIWYIQKCQITPITFLGGGGGLAGIKYKKNSRNAKTEFW